MTPIQEPTNSSSLVAGIDEAGRGPLAGPVVAAAVILDPDNRIDGLADSKKLSAKRREQLAEQIKQQALCWSISEATVAEIDELNILHATMLAMRRAAEALSTQPNELLIDGNRIPEGLNCPAQAIVGGDNSIASISAASILAKTHRDALLIELDQRYPKFGFAQHKGYGTQQHLQALVDYGVLDGIHRRSYAPVQRALKSTK